MKSSVRIRFVTMLIGFLTVAVLSWVFAILISDAHRAWLNTAGTNLGSLIAALLAASVGIVGAYWAARSAARAGVEEADRLENLRARRLAESDLYRNASKDFSQMAERVRDISFSYVGRDRDANSPKFISKADFSQLYALASEAMNTLSVLAKGDRALDYCWSSMHLAYEGFGWALDKIHDFERMPLDTQPPVRDRANAYISLGQEPLTEEALDALGPPDSDVWRLWAPPVHTSNMTPFRIAERHLIHGKDLAFYNSLIHCSSTLMRVSESRLSENFIPGTQSDILSLETIREEIQQNRPTAELARNGLFAALDRHRAANNDLF